MNRKFIDPIIILGSSNSHGNTRKAIDIFFPDNNTKILDLKELDITIYDYEHQNT